MRRWSDRVRVVALLVVTACSSVTVGSIGVRAQRDPDTGAVMVTDVPAGLGAAKAGIEPGDRILAVDGVPVKGMDVKAFHDAVRGPVGTHVKLTILRGEGMVEIEVERMALKEKTAGEE